MTILDRSTRVAAAVVTGWAILTLCAPPAALGVQAVVLNDAYTQSNKPTGKFGASATLRVERTTAATPVVQRSFLKFDLSAVPSGTTGSNVAKATLKVFVAKVTANGAVEVHRVSTGAINNWNESAIEDSTAPAIEAAVIDSLSVSTADKREFLSFDLTAVVMGWLDGSFDDNGIALVPASSQFPVIQLDSKEATGTSHVAVLEIVLKGGATGPGFASCTTRTNFLQFTPTGTASALCDVNETVTGGGVQTSSLDPTNEADCSIFRSTKVAGPPQGWTAGIRCLVPGNATVSAICCPQ